MLAHTAPDVEGRDFAALDAANRPSEAGDDFELAPNPHANAGKLIGRLG
jgi:hypothetical protein